MNHKRNIKPIQVILLTLGNIVLLALIFFGQYKLTRVIRRIEE